MSGVHGILNSLFGCLENGGLLDLELLFVKITILPSTG
jgi:hypothetical protein